jgi:hypothetical protein
LLPSHGFFYARIEHRETEVTVVLFERSTVPETIAIPSRDLCPFLGADTIYHIYAIGKKKQLDHRGASVDQRLRWMVTLSRATADVGNIGDLSSLWVDPETQALSVADYYHPSSIDGVIRLGQIALEMLEDTKNEDLLDFIDLCLGDTDRPSARECEKKFQSFLCLPH